MRKRNIKILLLATFIVLVIGNPLESRFMKSVQEDFGEYHDGMQLDIPRLKAMGQTTYRSFLICSYFEYSFGNIKVKYIGVLFTTFYLGNASEDTPDHLPEDQFTFNLRKS